MAEEQPSAGESPRQAQDAGKKAAGAAGAAGDGHDTAATSDLDDVKRKFREALDRKRDKNAHANAEGTQATGKVHDAHGPASSRRSFRRKSGG